MAPIALTIAGSDSGGGAGIQADLKTFSALGVYGASVITAVTAQNTRAVTAIQGMTEDVIAAQIAAVLGDLDVHAVKIGMLSSPAIIACVKTALTDYSGPVVLDPVMVAKSGDVLLEDNAIATLRRELLPRADLLTPNLPEAAALLRTAPAETVEQMAEQGRALCQLGARAVLMKGGHAKGTTCIDVLVEKGQITQELVAPRKQTRNTHGTGCTLSSAIAAALAKGALMSDAVVTAHGYLQGAIAQADTLNVGRGSGPVHHFHRLWEPLS